MRRVLVAAAAAGGLLLTTAASCAPQEEPTEAASPPAEETTSPEPEPTTPEPLDPATVDLGNREWTYEDAWHAPVDVPLQDGTAEGDWGLTGQGPMTYDESRRVVADMDDDGDQDVVAPLTFEEQTAGYAWTSWFVWLNDGTDLVQMPYAIAYDGNCVQITESIEPAGDGPGVRIDRLIMAYQEPCASTPTVEADRTVVVEYDDEGNPWPVQIDPGRFWGGLCVGGGGAESEAEHEEEVREEGVVDQAAFTVAPGLGEVAAPEPQMLHMDSGAWYSEVEGWEFMQVHLMPGGSLSDDTSLDHCVWYPED
ncbi:hypothetical protein [Georgenia alba]|uniref:Uncharacterized protein n=1 Tax=Georgenia alba TaxID=2233858 RepID=A0ABW2Q1Z7_9MICO